jgi:hypothetical protein
MKPTRRYWPTWSMPGFGNSFGGNWGDGTTPSSDGQRFQAGGRAKADDDVSALASLKQRGIQSVLLLFPITPVRPEFNTNAMSGTDGSFVSGTR